MSRSGQWFCEKCLLRYYEATVQHRCARNGIWPNPIEVIGGRAGGTGLGRDFGLGLGAQGSHCAGAGETGRMSQDEHDAFFPPLDYTKVAESEDDNERGRGRG